MELFQAQLQRFSFLGQALVQQVTLYVIMD